MGTTPEEKRRLALAFRKSLATERKLDKLSRDAIAIIKKAIRDTTSIPGKAYNYNKELEKKIKQEVLRIYNKSKPTGDFHDLEIQDIAATTIISTGQTTLSLEKVKRIIAQVNIDKFSKQMRPSLMGKYVKENGKRVFVPGYREDLIRHLKASIGQGKGVIKLAKELVNIDPVKLDIPQYIRDIEKAARRAIQDPKHYATFKRVLHQHRKYINNLARAGEPGFQHLGLRRAGRAFLRDIEKAVNDNTIDNVVDDWGRKKLSYIQQRVARTATSDAYHGYLLEYAKEAEHIIGIEARLSESHPRADICDPLARKFYFEDDPNPPLPTHHPNCLCYTLYIFEGDEEGEE